METLQGGPAVAEAQPSAYEPRPPGRRSAGRAATKWFLVIPFLLVAPFALIGWSWVPRVTSPAMVAEQAVDIGLTESARTLMLDAFASRIADERGTPEETIREVFDRSMTQEWFDQQVLNVTGELDRWLLGTTTQPPDLVVDLVPVKTVLASDPDALLLVTEFIGCEGIDCAPANQPAAVALVGVPDKAALLGPDADPEGLMKARSFLQTGRRMSQLGPLILAAEFALLILLARRHGRLRFAGGLLAVVGALVVLVTWLSPGWAGGELASSIPPDVPVAAADIAELVAWTLEPAKTMAYVIVAAGGAAFVGSFIWSGLSRRPV